MAKEKESTTEKETVQCQKKEKASVNLKEILREGFNNLQEIFGLATCQIIEKPLGKSKGKH